MSNVNPSIIAPFPAETEEFWVFGYGSLMWRPGFPFLERQSALLRGAHRALCVYSVRHRGTPEHPGLVLGLDHGGACRGIAFRVCPSQIVETKAYLDEREQMSNVYSERIRPLALADGRVVRGLVYIVNRGHRQYAHGLSREALIDLIRQGKGQSGACRDYVLNTLTSLSELGIEDHALAWLGEALAEG